MIEEKGESWGEKRAGKRKLIRGKFMTSLEKLRGKISGRNIILTKERGGKKKIYIFYLFCNNP